MSFLVLSLPRSRSTWLSRFLSYGDWRCGHDELRHMRSLADVKAWWTQPCTGSCETAAAPWWRLFPKDLRIVTIRRDPGEVVASLMRLPGLDFDPVILKQAMAYHDRKLDQVEARLPCLAVRYEALANEGTCAEIFEHCIPYAHDRAHWANWAPVNVQCDMVAMVRYAKAFPFDRLAAMAKQRILTRMAREPVVSDALTFQCESIDTWLDGGEALFAEHCARIGEAPDYWRSLNLPLLRKIEEMGALQIMTARSNGRMFGYLVTILAPSLASESLTQAANTMFFAAGAAPGTGLKLQRAALAELKRRGVGEVTFRDGVRGDGGRMAPFYKRLGAADDGRMFRLQLAEN